MAVDDYAKEIKQLTDTLKATKDAQAVKAEQVQDAKVIDALAKAVAQAKKAGSDITCPSGASVAELNNTIKTADAGIVLAKKQLSTLQSAAKQVLSSKDTKTAADLQSAKQSLQDAVDQASALLDSSYGLVLDNTTRVTLETVRDSAAELLGAGKG